MDPALEFVAMIKLSNREIVRRLNAAYRPLGLSAVQAEVLMVIGERGPMTLTELGGHIVTETGPPSRLVDRMVASGLLVRRPNIADGRSQLLKLTPEGESGLAQLAELRAPLLEEMRTHVTDSTFQQMSLTLAKLVNTSIDDEDAR